MHKNNSSYNAP